MPTTGAIAEKPSRPRRRWFGLRFSLRTLLLAITFVCIVSGLLLNRAVRQRAAVLRFNALSANRQPSHGEHLATMLYAHQGQVHSRPILPAWQRPLARLLGEQAFGEVTGVQILELLRPGDLHRG